MKINSNKIKVNKYGLVMVNTNKILSVVPDVRVEESDYDYNLTDVGDSLWLVESIEIAEWVRRNIHKEGTGEYENPFTIKIQGRKRIKPEHLKVIRIEMEFHEVNVSLPSIDMVVPDELKALGGEKEKYLKKIKKEKIPGYSLNVLKEYLTDFDKKTIREVIVDNLGDLGDPRLVDIVATWYIDGFADWENEGAPGNDGTWGGSFHYISSEKANIVHIDTGTANDIAAVESLEERVKEIGYHVSPKFLLSYDVEFIFTRNI